ncbi:MAG: GNAT family N-acetyltransferase [Acidimicrobiia bacterium]
METDVAITSLPWDSEFWGEPAGRVHLDEHHPASVEAVRDAIDRAQEAYDFVQILVPAAQTAHAQAAERAGFLLVDLRSEVVLDRVAHVAASSRDPAVKSATPSDVAPIAELAAVCHGNSRFGADPVLDTTRIEEFYRQWIRRDVAMPGWALAASERHGQVVGYVSYGRLANGDGTIGLVGVAPPARGAGLGPRLVAHAIESLFAVGCPRMTVVTQGGSAAAMKMYQASGFKVARLGYWLHWHRAGHRSHG